MDKDETILLLIVLAVIVGIVGFFWTLLVGVAYDIECRNLFGEKHYAKSPFPYTLVKAINCYERGIGKTSFIKINNYTAKRIKNTPKLIHLR